VNRPELCVGAAIRVENSLLLIQRGRGVAVGQWSIPGGRVEFGESLTTAVQREVEEETGLQVDVGALIGWVERFGPEHHFVIADFHATVRSGRLRPGDDASDAAWVPVDALPSMDLVDGLLDFLVEHRLLDQQG
jgi:8-oxo-dGTP diphosphatase